MGRGFGNAFELFTKSRVVSKTSGVRGRWQNDEALAARPHGSVRGVRL